MIILDDGIHTSSESVLLFDRNPYDRQTSGVRIQSRAATVGRLDSSRLAQSRISTNSNKFSAYQLLELKGCL